jgi:hypothetical protein
MTTKEELHKRVIRLEGVPAEQEIIVFRDTDYPTPAAAREALDQLEADRPGARIIRVCRV